MARFAWATAALLALCSAALPWGGAEGAPLGVARDWLRSPDGSDVALGLAIVGVIAVLGLGGVYDLVADRLEGRTAARRAIVVALAVAAAASLGVGALSDLLRERTPIPDHIVFVYLPRPIELWAHPLRSLVRSLLLAPPLLAASAGMASAVSARFAVRFIASHAGAGALLTWSAFGAGSVGFWASVAAVGFMFLTMALALPLSRRSKRTLALVLVGFAASMIVCALPAHHELQRRTSRPGAFSSSRDDPSSPGVE